ncbi:MAG: hypothetical protein GY899_13510 [Verrucomicrobiaceae bacterium]|nr:hypothetical protein [Verrucomicrobiaceae bacterium]
MLFPGRAELPAADFCADLLAVDEVGFVRDAKLRGGFSDPPNLMTLYADVSIGSVGGEGGEGGEGGKGGEEAVTIGASGTWSGFQPGAP